MTVEQMNNLKVGSRIYQINELNSDVSFYDDTIESIVYKHADDGTLQIDFVITACQLHHKIKYAELLHYWFVTEEDAALNKIKEIDDEIEYLNIDKEILQNWLKR